MKNCIEGKNGLNQTIYLCEDGFYGFKKDIDFNNNFIFGGFIVALLILFLTTYLNNKLKKEV